MGTIVKIIVKIVGVAWAFFSSVRLSVVLCFLLALDAAVAYPMIKMNLTTFIPLGEVGLVNWLLTYGLHNLDHTLWFYALMVLLTLLAVNTFACSTGRVLKMFGQCDRNRNKFRFFLNFGPHVMHYAVLVILLGYLGSYALSVAMPGRSLAPGGLPMKLPGGLGEVRLEKLNPEVYEGKRLAFFENWYLDPGYDLIHTDPKGKETRKRFAYSRSPSFAGYRFYLYDFYPKRSTGGSMGLNYTKISIRKDPSSLVYVGGLALFFLGLLMYAADIFLKWRRRREPAVAGPGAGDDRGHDAPAPGSDPLADSVDPPAPVPEKRKEAGTGA